MSSHLDFSAARDNGSGTSWTSEGVSAASIYWIYRCIVSYRRRKYRNFRYI